MKNDLFNQTLLRKYSKNFKLTLSKHELILKHIQKMDQGQFEAETKNYIYFYEVWLKDILGYDLDENVLVDEKEEHGRGKSEFILKSGDKKFMVVELKDQKTDLDKPQNRVNDKRTPVDQAFDYAQHTGDIDWILVSNYNEFRLYNWHKKGHFISFKVGELLDKTLLSYFLLTFSKKSHIETGYIDRLMDKTVVIERELEKEFYKLYNETRLMLIKEFEEINNLSRLESIHYAQMIMNRYMFICFAEDIDLLPAQVSTDTISNPILNGNLRHGSIWQRLNELFLDIDEGNEYKKISQYNGGIFKEDLEHLKIRDIVEDQKFFNDVYQDWKFKEYEQDVNDNLGPYGQKVNPIYRNLLTISTFDFSTELDVNILGHIFENSIGDIEELKEDSKGRRKKDGIFYTPEYITDYICRNTIIPFLSISGKINTIPELMGEYGRSKIEDLDIKVKNIKVVDPACGSGAFLNKAADILMEIHDAIRERLYTKDKLDHLWDPIEQRREILINNIYGVDLNEESVDITKLSLFLKVCRKGLILPNIDKNIKCGNSLIEDPEFTDKPFNWEKEFKEIFKNGGFDIVVGNPPYVDNRGFDKNQLKYFYENYVSFSKAGTNEFKTRKFNTFVAFIEKINQLSKKGGLSGYIVHKNLLKTTSYKGIRYLMLKNFKIDKIVDWGPDQFADVIAETISVILEKNEVTDNEITIEFFSKNKQIKSNSINQSLYLDSFDYIFNINLKPSEIKLLKKIENNKSKLSEFVIINNGIVTGNDKKFVISEEVDNYKICVTGKNIERYGLSGFKGYLNYDPSKLLRSRSKDIFEAKEKLIMQMINIKFVVYFDNDQLYNLGTTYAITKKSDSTNLKYILTILNSKLMEFYYLKKFTNESTLTNAISTKNIYELPIVGNINQEPFIEKSNQILILKNELRDELNGFKGWLQREPYNIVKFSKKLNKYYKLSFEEFLTELNKKKVDTKQRKTQELLKTEFEESVTIINPLLQQIKETDNEIDKMVYDLYGLTPEEIKLIEDCTK